MQRHIEAIKDTVDRPLWHDPKIMPDCLPALTSKETCDLLIVGGGFTGLWAAMQAKEGNSDLDIIIIEQTFVGDGASGRCGGFLNTSVAHGETNVEAQFPGEADRLQELGIQNMKEFLDTLVRYNIDARYEKTGAMEVALDPASSKRLFKDYQQYKEDGDDVVWFDKKAVRKQVNSPKFFAGCWHRDGQDGVLDPARLCWGLKDVLINQLGVRIYENTKFISVKSSSNGDMKGICESGDITSKKVLMATNAFTSSIGKIRRSVIPVWDYQISTEPLTDEQLDKINWGKSSRHAISDYTNMFHYFRLTKDRRITWGGGGAVRYYFNRGIDKKFMQVPARYEQLAKEFFETFPQLAGEIKFSNKWGGIIASSTRFCVVPGVSHSGRLAWAVGYTGHGVGASRFGARIGIELLGYQPTDIIKMKFVTKKALPWVPEPFCWPGVKITQNELIRADRNGGKRGLWLKFLDMLGLGFTC
ncbi:MAG: FAD-binding oxidoreductase [Kangiellaceae bacterium]|nr:FAD-binding oxidoreductase [Kangiellaceae bacterium]